MPYIAMEYLPRGSLRQYIGRLSMAQIAGARGRAGGAGPREAHGIVHRDLKPENLLVAVDGRVKIADFGVAKAPTARRRPGGGDRRGNDDRHARLHGARAGAGRRLTPATDLYSLGVVAWELLTGQVPFDETDTRVAVLYRHVHEPVPSVRSVAPEVDEGVAEWLEKMLAKRPEDRFQSARRGVGDARGPRAGAVGDPLAARGAPARSTTTPRAQRRLTPASFRSVALDTPVPDAAGGEAAERQPAMPETISGPAVQTPPPTVAPSRPGSAATRRCSGWPGAIATSARTRARVIPT